MKRREFNKTLAAATSVILTPFSRTRNVLAATTAGGATPVFSYANFSSAPSAIHLANALYSGSNLLMIGNNPAHAAASAWYNTQQPPTSFTTTFQFQPQNISGSGVLQSGLAFGIQNTVAPPSQSGYTGNSFSADANTCGYCAGYFGQDQYPAYVSMIIKFDAGDTSAGQGYPSGKLPSSTGMYFNGGPSVYPGNSLGLVPFNDLSPSGINFYQQHVYQVTIVYDGSLLTMVILDTTTNAQARFVWPLNLANTVNAASNYVGFTAGTASQGYFNILNWSYWSGYNTRLATPTFSPAPGQYSSTQSVTISYPAGSTCYYTTNGLLPTSSSTQYTGPITVSANEVIQAVAIQSGYTDSLVGGGAYQINTSNVINFPSGFAAGNLVIVGFAYLSGSTIRLTDTTQSAGGAAWFPMPVNVNSFSTTFTIDWVTSGQGMCFVIQNNPPAFTGLTGVQITGTGGQISFNPNNIIATNLGSQYVTITGNLGGTGSISGYKSPSTYFVTAATSTTATLQIPSASTQNAGTTLTTSPGTPTGLTYSLNARNWSGGPTVYGGARNALGYGGLNAINGTPNTAAAAFGLLNSVAIVFDQNPLTGSDPSNGVGLYTNGLVPYGSQIATGLSLVGTFKVTISYSGTTLTVSIQKTTGGTVFSHSWPINIASVVGGNTAYVGFTGSTYGAASIQAVQSWTYTAASSGQTLAVPAAPSNLKVQ
jgi:Chitobiase/beta-hexosaminidase C-terminal domain/Legume lectin domain